MWSIWPGIGFGNWTGCPKLGLAKQNREHMARRGTGNIWVKGSKMLEGRAKEGGTESPNTASKGMPNVLSSAGES